MATDRLTMLSIPDTARTDGRKIPSRTLAERARLTRRQQRLLGNMKSLVCSAALTQTTTGMPVHIDDIYDIRSVLVLESELGTVKDAGEILSIVHAAFPHPTIVVASSGMQCCISIAIPRKSLAETGATVIDTWEHSAWFTDTAHGNDTPWHVLAYDRLPHRDLFAYAHAACNALRWWNLRDRLGVTPDSGMLLAGSIDRQLLRLKTMAGQIQRLRMQQKHPDTPLHERARLRVEKNSLEREALELARHLTEGTS